MIRRVFVLVTDAGSIVTRTFGLVDDYGYADVADLSTFADASTFAAAACRRLGLDHVDIVELMTGDMTDEVATRFEALTK